MTGGEALVRTLQAEGVRYVFGNPGTTEIPLMVWQMLMQDPLVSLLL